MPTNFIWDENQVNYVEPSTDLFDNGYADDAVPTSGNTNWMYHNFSVNRVPLGQVSFFFDPNPTDGYLDCLGQTMGSSTSGAVYASSDYEDLFIYLWTYNSSLIVAPGGRGGSAASDWAANKTITLPNFQRATMAGVSTVTGSLFNTTPGSLVGSETVTLTVSNIPEMQPSITDPGHYHSMRFWNNLGVPGGAVAWGSGDYSLNLYESDPGGLYTYVGNNNSYGGVLSNTTGVTVNPLGGGQGHNNIQPSIVGRFKIKT
jgi:hypothetical protein